MMTTAATAMAGGTDNNQLKEAAKETSAVAVAAMAVVVAEMATATANMTATESWGRSDRPSLSTLNVRVCSVSLVGSCSTCTLLTLFGDIWQKLASI